MGHVRHVRHVLATSRRLFLTGTSAAVAFGVTASTRGSWYLNVDKNIGGTRGLGFVEVEPNVNDFDAGALLGPTQTVPGVYDYEHLVDQVRDQKTTNACVGFATVTAAFLRSRFQGFSPKFPSATAGYALGRAEALGDANASLVDIGTNPKWVVSACQKWGFCPEELWPFDVNTINTRPNWGAMNGGCGHYLKMAANVSSTGLQRVMDLATGLSVGYFPTIAVAVDPAFDSSTGFIEGPVGTSRGQHDVTLVGWDGSLNRFRMLNSWGTAWGDGGFSWISAERIADPTTVCPVLIETVELA